MSGVMRSEPHRARYVAKHLIANPAQVNQATLNSAELSDRRYCHDVEKGVKPGEVGWVPRV